jgi:hypothetical protein
MAVIDLPTFPQPASATPFFMDPGGLVKGGLGAPDQRINRLGGRFGISIELPVMQYTATARQWVSKLNQAQTNGGRIKFPQMDFAVGSPGTVLINGAGQSGSTLIVDGAAASYPFKDGQFFSIVTGGVHHLYHVTADTTANGSGQASLPIFPPLRVQHADNDVCNFASPMIEGFVMGDQRQWDLAIGNFASISFEIHERK